MLALAIDTATTSLSAALVTESQVLASISESADRSHAERLPVLVNELLTKAGVARSEINLVSVGVGPGAYTGLRVGLMFGIAFAKALNVDVVGICTHDAIAPAGFTGVVATDARRKEIYVSQYQSGSRIAGPIVVKPAEFDFANQVVIGDGVGAHPTIIQSGKNVAVDAGALGQKAITAFLSGERPAQIEPQLGHANSDGAGAIPIGLGLLLPPLPLYLRRPDVMEPK
jgi:tRNA threonylcarbamoyl adenosine modification protein YeaZ